MPTSTWAQKRAAIAAALQGGNPPSVGASPRVNPMIAAMAPQTPGTAGGSPGLMGTAPTQGQMMAQANASLQGAPGFNYVPPQVGPAPVPPQAGGGMGQAQMQFGVPLTPGYVPPGQGNLTPQQLQMQMGLRQRGGGGSGGGGSYTTSGRNSRGSSSGWGGAQRGGAGLY